MASRYEWTFDVKTSATAQKFPTFLSEIQKEAAVANLALRDLTGTVRKLGAAIRNAAKPLHDLAKNLNAVSVAQRQTVSAQEHAANMRQESAKAQREEAKAQRETIRLQRESAKAQREEAEASKKASKATNTHGNSWTRLAGIFNTWNKAARFVVSDLKLLFRGVTALTRGTISFIGAVHKNTKSFDTLEGQLRALLGTSKDAETQFDGLRQKAVELGKLPNVSAKQALKTMLDLKKAGNEYADVMERTPTAIRLGQAEGKDPAIMAKAASVAWNTFDKEMARNGKTFEDVGSLMEATVTGSFLDSITQISDSLKNGGETAKGFGLSMEQTMTVLGQFANKNLTAGRAGTAMRGIFSRLSRTEMPAVKDALLELGVNVVDSAGKFREWPALVEDLRRAFANVQGDAKKMNLYEALGGGHYKDFLKILVDQGVEGFEKQRQAILNNADALKRMEQEQSQSMDAAEKTYTSAIDNFWISWKNILKLPIKEYYQNVANIINTVANQIGKVASRFQDGRGSLKEWLGALQDGAFTEMFDGLKKEIQPYISTLKTVISGVTEATLSTLKSVLDEILGGETKEQLLTLGIQIGAAIAQGVIQGSRKVAKGLWEMVSTPPDTSHHQTVGDLWMDAAGVPTSSALPADAPAASPAPAASSGPSSWSGVFQTLDYRNTDPLDTYQTPGDKAKAAYVARARAVEQKQPLPPIQFQRGENGELLLNDDATAQLAGRGHLRNRVNPAADTKRTAEQVDFDLQKLQQSDQTKQTKEALATGFDKAKLSIVAMGGELKKWLVEPVNEFLQAMTQIKLKFDDIFASLKNRKVNIGEKFGLTSSEDANKQRYDLALSQYQTTQRRLGGAQTAEERAQIQEKLAGQAEALAGMTTGSQQKSFAQQAQRHVQSGLGDYQQAERIELKRKQIERDTTVDSIPLLQRMQKNMKTSGGELEVIQQLQAAYKRLGQGDDAAMLQKRINTLTIQQAEEQAQYLKLQLEKLDISNEHLKAMEAQLDAIASDTKTQTTLQQEAPLPAVPDLQF